MWEPQRAFALSFGRRPVQRRGAATASAWSPRWSFSTKNWCTTLVYQTLAVAFAGLHRPTPCRHAQVAKGNAHVLAKVDAVAESKLASHWGVSGYPTLMLFRDGEFFETYSGARATPPIKTFLEGHIS